MESSIAEFVERQLACELLPTESRQDQALELVKCFGHLKRGWECACLANQQKKFRACGFQQVSHAVACMFQAHQSKAVVLHVPGTELLRVEVVHAPTGYTSGLRIPAGWPCSGVHVPSTSELCSGCMSQAQSCSEFKLQMLRLRFVADIALATCKPDLRICTLEHTFSALWL